MTIKNVLLEAELAGIFGVVDEPLVDHLGRKAVRPPLEIDLYPTLGRVYPEMVERLRGKIIAVVNGRDIRVFDEFAEIMEEFKGTDARIRFIGGLPVPHHATLGELESGAQLDQ